jgi:hypothetical protein
MNNILDTFLSGFLVAIALNILAKICKKISSIIFLRTNEFNLSGYWISKHTNFEGTKIIEIMRFKQNKSDLQIVIKQYRSNNSKIYKFGGKGVITNNIISLYYYSMDKRNSQSGVMGLEIINKNVVKPHAVGRYYEINREKKSHKLNFYDMWALDLSICQKLQYKINRKNYSDYNRIDEYINRLEIGNSIHE